MCLNKTGKEMSVDADKNNNNYYLTVSEKSEKKRNSGLLFQDETVDFN